MLTLTRLISDLQTKEVINQQTIFQRLMQLQWSAIQECRDRRKVADALRKRRWHSLTLFRNHQTLPGRAEIHNASEFKKFDVDIGSIHSYLIEQRLNGASRQFGLDRMECDLGHIKELRKHLTSETFKQRPNCRFIIPSLLNSLAIEKLNLKSYFLLGINRIKQVSPTVEHSCFDQRLLNAPASQHV